MGGPGNHSAPIDLNAFHTTNFRSQFPMRGAEFHRNTRRGSTTCILSLNNRLTSGVPGSNQSK